MSLHSSTELIRAHGPAILPSLLLCDFGNLGREIERLEAAGVAALHLDVMDGVFVPNFTYGMTIVSAIRKLTKLPIDCHLMIAKPEQYALQFVEAGADLVSFHVEALSDPLELVRQLQRSGVAAGLAFNPGTEVAPSSEALKHCDLALVMSVEAGFGGQSFRPEVLGKLEQIRAIAGPGILLEIDGGVNARSIERCVAAGAEALVVGSAIFGQSDYGQAVADLNQLCSRPTKRSSTAH